MASVTLPRRTHHLHFIRDHLNTQSCTTDDLSVTAPTSPTTSNKNNSLKDLCSRFKRHFTVTKEDRQHTVDADESTSERRTIRMKNYESFTSSVDDPSTTVKWPDFEKVYDSIPPCLINVLSGIDDLSIPETNDDPWTMLPFPVDECSVEQMNLFVQCRRGSTFRRNAICQKIDKIQHNGQLDTFVQQLMVEKLMRVWS